MSPKYSSLIVVLMLTSSPVWAGPGNTIFNPTPDDKMRPMTTERPSKTDGPYSLDAGHIQIESNIYGYTQNDDCINGSCAESKQHFVGGSTNLRIGLTDNVDIQFISDLYRHLTVEDKATSAKDTHNGFGDTLVRLKINALGNNPSDKYSFAVLPFVKLPTNQDDLGNDRYEGGIELPFNVNFDGGWSLGGMTALNVVTETDNTGYDPAYVNSLIIGKGLTDKLSAYGEIYTYKADQSGAEWLNTLDFGTVYSVTDNFKIDANVAVGVSDAADDVNFFFGGAYRF